MMIQRSLLSHGRTIAQRSISSVSSKVCQQGAAFAVAAGRQASCPKQYLAVNVTKIIFYFIFRLASTTYTAAEI
jgi:hypothetical protein